MPLFSRAELEQAAELIYQQMPATPQYSWPLLNQRVGAEVFVKHENQTPTGAFKIRGAITFMDWLTREHPDVSGIITATRGNHGQGQARSATAAGLRAKVYVPHGNSAEKNNAMRAFGAELIEFGQDFDEARLEAIRVAEEEKLFIVPAFHREIVRGVATYALELFKHAGELDTVYVPIGCGSGICGVISARDALGLSTKVVGVVSERAAAAKVAFDTGELIPSESADTFADGMAVRMPVEDAFNIYRDGADRVITVSDEEIAEAIRIYYQSIHTLAEGAGAASLAALLQEKELNQNKRVGVILTGANMDASMLGEILQGIFLSLVLIFIIFVFTRKNPADVAGFHFEY